MVSLDPIGFDSEENPTDKDMDPSIFYPEDNPMGEDIAEDNPEDDEELRLFLKSIGIDWDWEDNEEDELDELDLEDDEPYTDRLESYQTETGLTEAVQTGVGELNGIPVAIGVMDFEFIGGSMGSVVGEKITRLIEYATKQFLPLIIVCASGGARMQEGSLSLMQMAKISSALYDHQSNKKSFYVSILTSPTTGGVTASFGMLGNIIIAEPNAYIAFAGKRVIEETLKIPVPEGSQEAELLFFEKGLFDLMVPRELLKGVLSELLNLHSFFPLNSNSIK
nr:acetyl-CoA carboxylase carboxyltransferase beta subunit [Nyctocalos pinnatum]